MDRTARAGIERGHYRKTMPRERAIWKGVLVEHSRRPVVLAIEDEPLTLMLAVDMIRDAGFDPLPASNADEALSIFERRDDIKICSLTSTCRDRWMGPSWHERCGDDGRRLRSSSRLGSAGVSGSFCRRAADLSQSLIMPVRYPTSSTAWRPESPEANTLTKSQMFV
jgi:hypothetical protein